jgi:hypothetical protein
LRISKSNFSLIANCGMVRAMKFSVLIAAAVFALTSVGARAEVLIYSGTVKQTELAVRKKPFVRKAFLVTDPMGESTQLVTYGKANKIKNREEEAIKVGDYFGGALTTGGPLLDIYTYLRSEDNLGVLRQSTFLRGFQKTVKVNLSQGQPVTASRAKFLKGTARNLVAALGSSYIEQELSLVLDEDKTIQANIRNLTAASAYDEIVAMLEAQGYTNL